MTDTWPWPMLSHCVWRASRERPKILLGAPSFAIETAIPPASSRMLRWTWFIASFRLRRKNNSFVWFMPQWMKRAAPERSEEHTSELQSRLHLVCRLLLEKKNKQAHQSHSPHTS